MLSLGPQCRLWRSAYCRAGLLTGQASAVRGQRCAALGAGGCRQRGADQPRPAESVVSVGGQRCAALGAGGCRQRGAGQLRPAESVVSGGGQRCAALGAGGCRQRGAGQLRPAENVVSGGLQTDRFGEFYFIQIQRKMTML